MLSPRSPIACESRRAVGGPFELTTPAMDSRGVAESLQWDACGTWTVSGRAALGLILDELRRRGVRELHLPDYLCQSILDTVEAYEWQYSFYPVSRSLSASPSPPENSALLVIHYFGWVNPIVERFRGVADGTIHLIEDACQAPLSEGVSFRPERGFVVASPRKFAPVPLGGWCNLEKRGLELQPEAEARAWQSLAARVVRGAYLSHPSHPVNREIEKFYLDALHEVEDFIEANLLSECALPKIALDSLRFTDWKKAAEARRANWQLLNELLEGCVQPIFRELPEGVVPLGYPVELKDRDGVRAKLAQARVFCPVHWPLPRQLRHTTAGSTGIRAAKSWLTLPIDQRYNAADIEYVAAALRKAV